MTPFVMLQLHAVVALVTQIINGGQNGLADRKVRYSRAQAALA